MNWKLTERIVAGAVFVYATIVYLLTVAPTASFWDSGEFIAIANQLQVSHPPGAPFYMLVGRFFSMFVPDAFISLSVNMVSVLSSSLTVFLTHLIIVRLVREWQGAASEWTTGDRIVALAGGVIGALTYAVTDSFWFNAVEAEVYAFSMFFTAIVVWLIMKWSEQARQEEALLSGGQHPFGLAANRYLILIAYLFGLAIGVHLLNLLAVFFCALIFFFEEFDKEEWTTQQRIVGIGVAGVVSSIIFLSIYPVIIQKLPDWAGRSGVPVLFVLAIIAALCFGLYYTQQRRMQVANLIMLCVTTVLIGYSTYALIFIRSAADPPIDENDPENTEAIVSYLKREQYGETPILRGRSYNNATGTLAQREKLFPRRHSPDPNHMRVYSRYDSDGQFFWQYQINHMYFRYFGWNFIGRDSDIQEAAVITGFSSEDPYLRQTPSEQASRNAYFGLPLLLGLIGMFYHFMRDWRRAFSVMVLFLVSGVGIILYLNQTPMQPRERDYSYVASFFAFTLWVGIGGSGILQLLLDIFRERAEGVVSQAQRFSLIGVGALLFVAVPGWMLVENYDDHDRSGRYVAPDYAYNMLMSLADDAIIFTNGDNDTFPLWYLQEVEAVRRDVRVVNLSLLNTPWYVRQLKNQSSRDSAPLPISMPEARIADLNVVPHQPQDISIPVDLNQLFGDDELGLTLADTSMLESPMTWRLEGRPYSQDFNLLYGADQAALDIIATNAQQGWKRPVYFAVTVSPDGQLGLEDYFQLEGQAFRVVPIRHNEDLGRVVPGVTPERLKQFRFTNLDDPDVYYDENIRRMVDNYRNIFSHTAQSLADMGDAAGAREILDLVMEKVPFETIPGDVRSFILLARTYAAIGDEDTSTRLLNRAEPLVLHDLKRAQSTPAMDRAIQFFQMLQLAYLQDENFDAASTLTGRLAETLGDPSYSQTPEEMRRLYEAVLQAPPPSAP
ncbi:MAG: DUF2723 domain-containing protein [Bacteroidota bacterium]